MEAHVQDSPGFLARWGAYFRERFPPLQYAVALAVFSFAMSAYTRGLSGQRGFPDLYPLFVGFAVTFLLFLQLRILDEFKDYEEDARYRPYRPVPRGLVSLHSLGRLWFIAAGIQLALSASLGPELIALLALILAYSGLMGVEFFVRTWLKRHAAVYMASHMLIVPMIAVYVAACTDSTIALRRLAPYLAFAYFNYCVFELGRKIRSPGDEQTGVETYSALWGPSRAASAWLGAMGCAALAGLLAAQRVGAVGPFAATAVTLGIASTVGAIWFLSHIGRAKGRIFESFSAIWFLGIQLAFGTAVAFN
jgi:4-hydroxybenzoate polyprenyltransferase